VHVDSPCPSPIVDRRDDLNKDERRKRRRTLKLASRPKGQKKKAKGRRKELIQSEGKRRYSFGEVDLRDSAEFPITPLDGEQAPNKQLENLDSPKGRTRSSTDPGLCEAPLSDSKDETEEESESDEELKREEKDGRKVIIAGTLDKLLDCLVSGDCGPDFIKNILLTHPYFTDSSTMLQKLKERFNSDENSTIIKLRVINVVKKWLDGYYYFFEQNTQLLDEVKEFVSEMSGSGDKEKEWAALLSKIINEKQEPEDPLVCNTIEENEVPSPELKPYLPSNIQNETLTFNDLHPLEVARQMTLLDHAIFKLVSPLELYKSNWTKGEAPNILALTKSFNKRTFWVATEIIATKNHKMRVQVLSRFIQIAMYLRSMNNLHGVMEIYAALNLGCVQRLKETWKNVDKKYIAKLKELEDLFNPQGNYVNYRERLEAVSPPIIPFQAVILGDLTFIEEVPSFLENGLINFDKMILLGKVLTTVIQYQKYNYKFYDVPPIREYLSNGINLLSENELYDIAKQIQLDETAGKKKDQDDDEPVTLIGFDSKEEKKQIKELEKQEKKLLRSMSFRTQQRTERRRAGTFT